MTTLKRIWVLGAADPEMAAIEKLLQDAGEKVAYATCGKVRVHPGNAYRADGTEGFEFSVFYDAVMLVECGFCQGHPWEKTGITPVYAHPTTGAVLMCQDGTEEFSHDMKVVRIDHHRPGDAGYGGRPEGFLLASSIGQVILALRERPEENLIGKFRWIDSAWYVGLENSRTGEEEHGSFADVPEQILFAAAADHCLEAAYRGRCPGVDPDALMKWRAETRASFQKRPVADVLRDVESARKALRDSLSHHWMGQTCGRCGRQFSTDTDPALDEICPGVRFLVDLRGQQVPELPEAAAREGIPFLSTVKDKDGREKVVLQAAGADLVKRFLAGEVVKDLTDFYGDPARGFAGGYIKPKQG